MAPSAHADAGPLACSRGPAGGQPLLMAVRYEAPFDLPALDIGSSSSDLLSVRLPDNLGRMTIPARKAAFVETVLPLLEEVNARIAADRARLIDLAQAQEHGCASSAGDSEWLFALATSYDTSADDLDELLKRVDGIPLSLGVAMAAIESAWGTSRFVRQGNALFGERTYNPAVPGMKVPNRTAFRVRSFNTLYDSVVQYINNLNTHNAYAQFRHKRADFRDRGAEMDSYALAPTLDLYSEMRGWYTTTLIDIMRHNGFHRLDATRMVAVATGD